MSVSINLGPARPRYRAVLSPRDVERLELRFVPSLARRLAGLALTAWAAWVVLLGVRGEGAALAGGLALACAGVLLAFGRRKLVLDRRHDRIETAWGAPLLFARFLEARGPFDAVAFRRVEEQRSVKGETVEETTHPVVVRTGAGEHALGGFPTWEVARGFAEAVARFLGVGLEDQVQHRRGSKAGYDEPLARSMAPDEPPAKAGERPPRTRELPAVSRWIGDDELVVEIPRPGRPTARQVFGLLALVAVIWTPLALCAGAVVEGLLPLVLIGAAGVKLCWGYGATVVANARGLTVDSRGLVRRRRTHIPLAELESLLLVEFERGGARSVLAHFFQGVLVARSDRTAVRFGHGLSRRDLIAVRDEIARLLARLGRTQVLSPPAPEPLRPTDRLAPVLAAWAAGAAAGAWLGPPASFGLNLPVLSVGLSALAVSAALVARFFTRRDVAPARGGALTAVPALVALACALWLGLDVLPGWFAATPDRDLSAFWSAIATRPGPAARESWLQGLTGPQAASLWLGTLGLGFVLTWALGATLVPAGLWLARRLRKKPDSLLLPLAPPRDGLAPRAEPAPAAWRRQQAPVLLAALTLVWSAALFPDAWRPLGRAREAERVREAAAQTRWQRERLAREETTRALLRPEVPPPGTLSRGRPALWLFADYLGPEAALVEHLPWLRRAHVAAGLHVVGFPSDVHGDALARLLDARGWHGEHVADANAAAAYREWSGFQPGAPRALLLNADGSVRDRLAPPWDVERRLEEWLGPASAPRPDRRPVAIELRVTHAGRPVELPAQGRVDVLAYDAWDPTLSYTTWLDRRGALPRGSVPLEVLSGAWRVRLQARAFDGKQWTPALDGWQLVLLPATEAGRRVVEIPVEGPALGRQPAELPLQGSSLEAPPAEAPPRADKRSTRRPPAQER